MQIQHEKLWFDPDPLGFNSAEKCDCLRCRTRRQLAQMIGVPEHAIVQMQISPIDVGEAAMQAMKGWGGVPQPVAIAGPSAAPVPLITAFDTNRDGTPRVGREAPPATEMFPVSEAVTQSSPASSTPSLVGWVRGCFVSAGEAIGRFLKAQPKLRVVADE